MISRADDLPPLMLCSKPPRPRLTLQELIVGIWFILWMTVLAFQLSAYQPGGAVWMILPLSMLLLPLYVQTYRTIKNDLEALAERPGLPREPTDGTPPDPQGDTPERE